MFLSPEDFRSILALMSRVESIKPAEARAFCALEDKIRAEHNALVEQQAIAQTAPALGPASAAPTAAKPARNRKG